MSTFGPPRAHKSTPTCLRTALQALLVALGLVAFVAGLVTVFTGTGGMPGDSRATPFLVLMGLELILPLFIVWAQARIAPERAPG